MSLRKYILFVILGIPVLAVAPPLAAQQSAINDITLEARRSDLCMGAYAKNNNSGSRVLVTIKKVVNVSFPWLSSNFNLIYEPISETVGLLLLPGEEKLLGCTELRIGSPVWPLTYKYTKEGAYYPNPNLHMPDNDKPPREYVRIYMDVALNSPLSACPRIDPPPTGVLRMINLHPTRTINVTFTKKVPGKQDYQQTANLTPYSSHPIGCDNEASDTYTTFQSINF